VPEPVYDRFLEKKRLMEEEMERLRITRAKPTPELNAALAEKGTTAIPEDIALDKLLKRPEIGYEFIRAISPSPQPLTPEIESLVEIHLKYEGYIRKQLELAERMKKLESKRIPDGFDYSVVPGLSREVVEKLRDVQPETIGQAGRIPGVTPAAVSLLLVAAERQGRQGARTVREEA
jgi:tRNA uridine 5-carboxymethylaminomethyl modification enzyme